VAEAEQSGDGQDGFTLVEIMVVLIIVAVLIAIAVPTFLGTTTQADERQAQSNLSNALVSTLSVYSSPGDFSVLTPSTPSAVAALKSVEPSMTYVDGSASTGPSVISFTVPTATPIEQVLLMAAKSASGTCWWIMSVEVSQAASPVLGETKAGTYYAKTATGTACQASTPPAAGSPQLAGPGAGKWAGSFTSAT
jgi:type IV pilus assembly protein PilA